MFIDIGWEVKSRLDTGLDKNDLIRLKEMVEKSARKLKGSQSQKEIAECTTRINLELTRLEDEIQLVKKALPFGLRPYKVSKLIGWWAKFGCQAYKHT